MEADYGIKRELNRDATPDRSDVGAFDYNRLYGELYRKLLTTPVQDIFNPSVSMAASPAMMSRGPQVTSSTGALDAQNSAERASPSTAASGIVHPAFPFPVHSLYSPTNGSTHSFQESLNSMIFGTPPNKPSKVKSEKADSISRSDTSPLSSELPTPEMMYGNDIQGDMDVGALVEEFRVTLEKYGVSQRFAARYIMQDTSQGNLSFLIEKGRNKKWQELSPRGRVPYLKMKAWLESKEQQMWTLEMLKQSQEMKKVGPRDSYNRRERFSMFQLTVLCRLFEENSNPPMDVRNAVAERLNIPLDRVNVWFQNQRARGFPAKKMLQQSGFVENQNVPNIPKAKSHRNLKYEDTSPVSKKNCNEDVQAQDVKPDFGKWHCPVSDLSPFQPVFPDLRNRIPLENKHIQPSEPLTDQSTLPLDLSAGKQSFNGLDRPLGSNINLSQEMSSTEKVNGYLDHIGRVESENSSKSSQSKTSPANSLTKQTGAAKRKRGNVCKHVSIYAQSSKTDIDFSANPTTNASNDVNDINEDCSTVDHCSKKFKGSLETDVNQEITDDTKEFAYTVRSSGDSKTVNQESSTDLLGYAYSKGDEAKLCVQGDDTSSASSEGYAECDDEGNVKSETGSVDKGSDGKENGNKSTKASCENNINAKVSELVKVFEEGETVSPETVSLFKSFCANLLMKNKVEQDNEETKSN